MLFRRQDSIIHIVVLYKHPGTFLWHAAVESGNSTQKWTSLIGDRQIQFGKYEGIYDNMEIVPTKLDGVKLNIPKDPAAFLQQIPDARFLECNYEQARAFYTAYGSDLTAKDVKFIRHATSLLSKSKAVLDRIGVRFWICSGTLLGWFRQCGIIPYTNDVDIGIWIKDYKDTLIPAFQAAGLSLRHKFGKMEDSFQLAFKSANVKIDIFFFYEEGDIMWFGATDGRTGEKFKYISPRFTLCWTEFLDMKVRVPCQTLAYIHADYGPNWYEPVKEWDWKNSAPNIQPNGQWPEEEWSEVIQYFHAK
ncbi:PREDICTED: fukutin-like isoform X1 [Branchiostoma belcheri]|uniref:Ribitol-5-phosphate transferase n=2 Tax=Branchiostoma belcheri TaxID=7741 RepID=A0A6P5AAF9_BRABE|nr:PREDICTED: fukutin-like isoform X1 [Branchiostoma belcheri]